MVIAFVAAYLMGGNWGETRALQELLPLMALPIYQNCLELLGISVEVRTEDEAEPPRAKGDLLLVGVLWTVTVVTLMAFVVAFHAYFLGGQNIP